MKFSSKGKNLRNSLPKAATIAVLGGIAALFFTKPNPQLIQLKNDLIAISKEASRTSEMIHQRGDELRDQRKQVSTSVCNLLKTASNEKITCKDVEQISAKSINRLTAANSNLVDNFINPFIKQIISTAKEQKKDFFGKKANNKS